MRDERPQHLKDADELLKKLDESIKDDMLYFIAQNYRHVFEEAKLAAM